MANLLLEKDKKEIFKEFIFRFIIAFLFLILVTISLAGVMIAPSYVLTISMGASLSDEIKVFKQTIDFRKQDSPADILNKENIKINAMKTERAIYMSNFISEIVGVKPVGVKIKGFFYDLNRDSENYLIVRGESKNRNTLITFIDDLGKKDVFSQIDFPISNLIKGESVSFSVKIYPKDF